DDVGSRRRSIAMTLDRDDVRSRRRSIATTTPRSMTTSVGAGPRACPPYDDDQITHRNPRAWRYPRGTIHTSFGVTRTWVPDATCEFMRTLRVLRAGTGACPYG